MWGDGDADSSIHAYSDPKKKMENARIERATFRMQSGRSANYEFFQVIYRLGLGYKDGE